MKYPEYLEEAKQRLKACRKVYNEIDKTNLVSANLVYHELFYLSGYIIEGLCVYSIFYLYEWDKDISVDAYNQDFFDDTGLCFSYKHSKDYYGEPNPEYVLQSHKFKEYVDLLRSKPDLQHLPFFSSSSIDLELEQLIEKWSTHVRYNFQNYPISKLQIEKLLNFCQTSCQYITDNFTIV